jgi:hypothetical protein
MDLKFNDDFSGTYKIYILIDQDAQLYALETGQSSAIGGLDAILSNLPDGFGSSIYQDGDYLGILVRNDFTDTEDLKRQFELLNENENTSLLLLPIEDINFSQNRNSFSVNGIFGEFFVSDEESADGYDNVFDGQLSVIVPGSITSPKLDNIIDNTVIFEIEGISAKTFEVVTNTRRIFNISIILLSFFILFLMYFFVRQYQKKK